MESFQIWGILGLIMLGIEIFTPTLFFLNLAISAIFTAFIIYITKIGIFGLPLISINLTWQVIMFAVFSALLLFFLRPFLVFRVTSNENEETGINAKYIGSTVRITEKVSNTTGRGTIYGEAWDIRPCCEGEEFEVDETVKIVKVENLTLFVEKCE